MAVATSERIRRIETFGGHPRGDRVDGRSIWFLASVTKPIVATGVMQLVDAGLLDLDEPISRVIPEFRAPDKPDVTARHLLSHTSGLQDLPVESLLRQRPSAQGYFHATCRAPLHFPPGTAFTYCSDSFTLLAALIVRLTGRPFPLALRRSVFGPVGMVDTTFDPRSKRPRLVPVHNVGLENRLKRRIALRYLSTVAIPGGGLWSSPGDLIGFGQALLNDIRDDGRRLLSRAAIEEMTREQTEGLDEVLEDGSTRPSRYALGWGKPADGFTPPASSRAFSHGGATGTRLWVDPDRDLVFVFLTNLWGISDDVMFAALRDVYRAAG